MPAYSIVISIGKHSTFKIALDEDICNDSIAWDVKIAMTYMVKQEMVVKQQRWWNWIRMHVDSRCITVNNAYTAVIKDTGNRLSGIDLEFIMRILKAVNEGRNSFHVFIYNIYVYIYIYISPGDNCRKNIKIPMFRLSLGSALIHTNIKNNGVLY